MDEVIDVVDELPMSAGISGASVGGLVILSLAVGAVIGYAVGVKRTTLKYEEILEEEIEKAKDFFARSSKSGPFETPEKTAETLGVPVVLTAETTAREAFRNYQGGVESPETYEPAERNIFVDPPVFDLDQERSVRAAHPEDPYVISKDEYDENEPGHDQVTVTYFDKDDTLVDARDQVIDDVDGTVGINNLQRFGHGSVDNRVVLVRNERLDMDFEVVKSDGSYAKEVLGFDEDQLKHSDIRMRTRRRTDE